MELMNAGFETMHGIRMTYAERAEMLNYLVDFYLLHDQDLAGLKSLKILKELFATYD